MNLPAALVRPRVPGTTSARGAFGSPCAARPTLGIECAARRIACPKRARFRAQIQTTRLVPLPVPGGYFQLVDYSAVSDLDDAAFCRWLTVEKGVAAIPLSPFYETPPQGQRLARLCFAKNQATLDAAIERLQHL